MFNSRDETLPNSFVNEKPPLQRFLVATTWHEVHQAQATKNLITNNMHVTQV